MEEGNGKKEGRVGGGSVYYKHVCVRHIPDCNTSMYTRGVIVPLSHTTAPRYSECVMYI